MKKFWDFIKNEATEETPESYELRLEGTIDEDAFWGDETTPKQFREELEQVPGDLTVWINSPGGNVFAASEIYTMLRDHKGTVTVKIDAMAASAASVVAMAGDEVQMAPTAMMMIHDPSTIAMGNEEEFTKAISILQEVKETIVNAYVIKTGRDRAEIAQLMKDETWMNARKAVELGFADKVMFDDGKLTASAYSPRAVMNLAMERFRAKEEVEPAQADEIDARKSLEARMRMNGIRIGKERNS